MTLKSIYDRLNLTPENGLCFIDESNWKNKLSKYTEKVIVERLKPKSFFCFDNKPLILFFDSPQNRKELFRDIWNFNEAPIIIINEETTIDIYNGFSLDKEYHDLDKLDDAGNLDNFSYFELITGKSLEKYTAQFSQKNRINYNLLRNIKEARSILTKYFDLTDYTANALIGRCIFVRYLIDRCVRIDFENQPRLWTNEDFCNLLGDQEKTVKFFQHIGSKFNGEAFLISDDELKEVDAGVFKVLKDLLSGTHLSSGQLSLFNIYDFSIIPIEFISNIYEYFIGKENQAKKGAYYTPKFLVDYILNQTIDKHYNENPDEYNCKILDPACGSGIFLVEALRRIIERYRDLNGNSISNKKLNEIAESNIYGIDKDNNAVNVAIFSIYLTLLDYQEPKDIENFQFPNLREKGNFHDSDFFDLNAKFNELTKMEFDFIVGNPPWKRGSSEDALFLTYVENRIKEETERTQCSSLPEVSDKQIAQAFLLRVSDFCGQKTLCSLVITSKILYNLKARKFREYLLKNYFIDRLLELSPVRREIFDESNDVSIAPAAVVFFRYAFGEDTLLNKMTHICLKKNRMFSLFKIFVIQRDDINIVIQRKLLEYDWLWKLLVYGSFLDFRLIERLKSKYENINSVLKDLENTEVRQGIMVGGADRNDVTYLSGQKLLDTTNDIKPFYVNSEPENTWTIEYVHRARTLDFFSPPVLIVKEGTDNKLHAISGISYSQNIFKSSLTGIKTGLNNINILRIINGILNSDLYSYFILHTASTIGIEREQVHDFEKWNTPFVYNDVIASLVENLEKVSKQLYSKNNVLNSNRNDLDKKREKLISLLNQEIFRSYQLNDMELALVDYSRSILVPLIMKQENMYKDILSAIHFKSDVLVKYINIFFSRFKRSLKGKRLVAEVYFTESIIGVFFRVVSKKNPGKNGIVWNEIRNVELLKKIISLGVEEISTSLFIQKDIRGFERDGFYIIKPNEKKLWHLVNGYLDANDFMDSILREGRRIYSEQ
ncbi:N-6 DNA methylase [bacterium]|nr:N-6 DNA methylase [bacterium]